MNSGELESADRPLSEYTVKEILQIHADLPVATLNFVCNVYRSKDSDETSQIRGSLKTLEKAIRGLAEAFDNADSDTLNGLMLYSAREGIGNRSIRNMSVSDVHDTAEKYLKVIDTILDTESPKGGRPPKVNVQSFSLAVAVVCQASGMKLTKYKDGEFHSTLALLMKDVYPQFGESAHHPYANQAIDRLKNSETLASGLAGILDISASALEPSE